MRRRSLPPAPTLRGARLQRRRPRPEGLSTASPSSRSALRRGPARLPGDEATITPATSRPPSRPRAACSGSPRSTCPTATRPARTILLQARLAEALQGAHVCCWLEESARARRRLQRHPRAATPDGPAGLDQRCPVPAGEPRAPTARSSIRPHRRCAACIPSPASTRSGTIRPAPSRRNDGIRIDHLLLSPQAQDKLQSAAVGRTSVAGRSRRTMCR